MPSISSLIHKLQADYPDITFVKSEQFSWSPKNRSVSYSIASDDAKSHLIHEVSHAILNHSGYLRDVELLAMETSAWEKAKEIGPSYGVHIDEDEIQDSLDTYRDWLHARSTCPNCTATGFQIKDSTYKCLACSHMWRVNEAKLCRLRRYSI